MAKPSSVRRRRPQKPELRKKIPAILDHIAEGKSLRSICDTDGFPPISTFLTWVASDAELEKAYRFALEIRADVQHEEMMEIADDGRNDWMEVANKNGEFIGWTLNKEAVARSKLRLDQRKWSASRMNPKKYGDKVDLNHGGKVQVVTLNADDDAV